MKRCALVLFAAFAPAACTKVVEPEPCEKEFMEFSDTDTRSRLASFENAGWDCELISSRRDPIFGIVLLRDWGCTRCK